MAKTQFQKGTPVTKEWLNAISNPVFDGANEDGHHPPIADSDLSDAPGQVKDRLTTAQTTITALGSAIADKADQSALTALQTTVGGKANQSDLTALQSVVNTKADAATAATKTELASVEALITGSNAGGITEFATVTDLTTLEGVVNTKANQSDLTALQTTVSAKADTATTATKAELGAKANQSDLAALQASVDGKADAATAATKTELNAKANQSDLTALQATVSTKADTATTATKAELSALTIDSSKIASGVIDAARIPDLDANKITTGILSTARLGSGVASNTTYLRGDNTWQTISSGVSVTQQTNPPTEATNATLNSLVYATSVKRLYICVDATTNNNVWRYFNSDGETVTIIRNYPGGTLSDGVGAGTSPNKSIADQDILWHIGTNRLTTSYTNPIDGLRITQTNSGVESTLGFGSPVVLADRSHGTTSILTYASLNQPNSFFTLDFGATTRVFISKIAIQQRGDNSLGSFHRTLQVSYSSDGSSFTACTNFTASTSMGGWSTFDVTNYVSSRYFRVTQTSLNNTGYNYFTASEILLYGTITYL